MVRNVGKNMKKLNVIGLGYIGLPTALMFANSGVEVVGTDCNSELISKLNNGEITFEENGLKDLFNKAIQKEISFTTEYVVAEMYLVSVPTPFLSSSKKLDAKYVVAAMNSILDVCPKGSIVIIESTITPGTIDRFIRPEIERRGFICGVDIHLVHAPERIIPGNMIYELEKNSRTIGADSLEVGEEVKELYRKFCKSEVIITDIKSAEMSKVVENTYRDVNIAFANELAKICHESNLNVYEIINIANKHPRVNILQPGPGVGGHCISVDPWFLVGEYPELTNLIHTARITNDSMPKYVFERIKNIMSERKIDDFSKVGLYGLTYKENIDDVRESPTLQLLEVLHDSGINEVRVFDPYITQEIVNNQYFDFDEFLDNMQLIVIMVSHNHIQANQEKLNGLIIYDTKNIISNTNLYKI